MQVASRARGIRERSVPCLLVRAMHSRQPDEDAIPRTQTTKDRTARVARHMVGRMWEVVNTTRLTSRLDWVSVPSDAWANSAQ